MPLIPMLILELPIPSSEKPLTEEQVNSDYPQYSKSLKTHVMEKLIQK